MDVARGEKFLTTRLEPTVAGVGLTLRAVPIPAAVGGDGRTLRAQSVHSSRCPPKAAVRQRAMARNTLRCCQVIHLRLRSMKVRPAARTRSATSRGGRFIIRSALPYLSAGASPEDSRWR